MDREDLVFSLKLAEQAADYSEMIKLLKELITTFPELTPEERGLLAIAYKNWVASRRNAWRAICDLEHTEEGNNSAYVELLRKYKKVIEGEVENICSDLIGLLDTYLIPNAKEVSSAVFYLKMKGDYHRYWAECLTGDRYKTIANRANEAYRKAEEKAEILGPANPIKLGLALNYSVFQYEILNSPETACKVAKSGFEAAEGELTKLDEEKYKEANTIMGLLKDNLKMWEADVTGGE